MALTRDELLDLSRADHLEQKVNEYVDEAKQKIEYNIRSGRPDNAKVIVYDGSYSAGEVVRDRAAKILVSEGFYVRTGWEEITSGGLRAPIMVVYLTPPVEKKRKKIFGIF